jgi:eukaryotic-like serine/threonine-protein kinase
MTMGQDPTVFQEPPDSREGASTGFGLPHDLLEKSRYRIRMVGMLVLAGSGIDMVMMLINLAMTPTEDIVSAPFTSFIPFIGNVISIALSSGIILAAGNVRIRSARLLDLGLVFEVTMCAVVSVTNPLAYYENTGAVPLMTWVTPLIILFPLIVPSPPKRTLVTAVLAALTAPLGLVILDRSGALDATVDAVASIAFSPALAVVMAFYGSRVVYGLGLEVANARRMGSYQLERLLGRGGMGEVWLARHRLLARPAAVKLVRADLSAPGSNPAQNVLLQRFEREAQTTASLRSAHTIALYDFGVSDKGTFYYVMELLDGLDLQTLVERFGPISAERTMHFLVQICESLAEAHDRGLMHRDIKPANIYVCRYGRDVDYIKVLDFGLVKAIDTTSTDQPQLTMDNVISGTPAYMAPEQILGHREQDARSDIYAVGCTAYWMLTGQLVFEGTTAMDTLMQHAHTAPVPPSQRTEVPVPAALDLLVLACLEKDPDRRPQTADDLSAGLLACRTKPWSRDDARLWWDDHRPGLDDTLGPAPR